MKGSFISKFSGDTTGAARCPGPTNPVAAGGTLTTRLILRCCDISSPSEKSIPVHSKRLLNGRLRHSSAVSPIMHSARSTVTLILRRSLCLRRSLRAEDALETFAVLQENQNPQHGSDQSRRDGAR